MADTYFTGKPCKNGHVAERLVSNRTCVECNLLHGAKWRAVHHDRVRKPDTRKRVRDKTRARAYVKRWQEKNRETYLLRLREYRNKNREAYLSAQRERQRLNPESRRVREQKRRALQAGAEGRFTADDIARITKFQNGKCACCGKKRKLTVDHIKPLTKGGSNWPSNLQMLCGSCNSAKGNRDPVEHRQSLGMLI